MTDTITTRRFLLALVAGVTSVALLYQIVSGWDTGQFLLRAVLAVALTLLLWRGGALVGRSYGSPGMGRRFVLHLLVWVLAALTLFAGFRLIA